MKVLDWSSCCCCCFIVSLAARLAETAPSSGDQKSAADSSSSINRRAWPPMKHHDIWSAETDATDKGAITDNFEEEDDAGEDDFQTISSVFGAERAEDNFGGAKSRQSKVIHLFPVPVDGECLSDDGRRVGSCFNAYECRQRGGAAKGECAMGFGVCCIFIASCNETVSNNITYLVSPNFPSFMPNNFTSCQLKVRMLGADISQLRIDFYHFSLGQPNRRTGVCDGDIFNVSGGAGGTISLCGQNSGQHIYYDVGGRTLPRQTQTLYGSLRPLTYDQLYPQSNNSSASETTGELEQFVEINMKFAQRFLPIRLWEIRIAQIPFSQRAPAGCLQYHTGTEGFLQTFNFAENGRHLANQHYRICMRQETEMCSIMYQPCDEQSFRIGPLATRFGEPSSSAGTGGGGATSGGGGIMTNSMGSVGGAGAGIMGNPIGTSPPAAAATPQGGSSLSTVAADDPSASAQMMPAALTSSTVTATNSNAPSTTTTTVMMSTTTTTGTTTTAAPEASSTAAAADDADNDAPQRSSTPSSSTLSTTTTALPTSPLSDTVEGSGGDEGSPPERPSTNRRPRPVGSGGGGGGFNLLGFLRNAFEFGFRRQRGGGGARQKRQFYYSTCSDRLTMPCIIEDFIGTGFGPLPGCEPVHCGNQFCSSGLWPCRVESTVTPFYIGVNFGDGSSGKGSAEDNIGACLRYMQVACM